MAWSIRLKNYYYAFALTDFFVFLSCAEMDYLKINGYVKRYQRATIEKSRKGDGESATIHLISSIKERHTTRRAALSRAI